MTDRPFLDGPGQPGLVSVIVPTYNRASMVTAAVDSILASTYTNIEAIVVDDGSTDNTRRIMANYSDSRVRYFHTENSGMSAARNHGFEHARGEYIAFLDSDDEWMPWKLAAQIELLRRHPDVGLVWTDKSAFEGQRNVIATRYMRKYYAAYDRVSIEAVLTRCGSLGDLSAEAPAEWLDAPYYVGNVFREMFLGSLVPPSTAVARRDRIRKAGNFDFALTGPGAEDYHFYYRISEHGPVALLDAPTVLYRINDPRALSRNHLDQARGNLAVVSYWLTRERPALRPEVERARVAGAYAWLGTAELFEGDLAAARSHLWQAMRRAPNRQIALRFALSFFPKPTIPALRKVKRILRGNPPVPVLFYVLVAGASLIHGLSRVVMSFAHTAPHVALLR